MSTTLKIMTCNLRVRTEKDGNNIFDLRLPNLLEMLRREAPDVIGFQEANDDMYDLLEAGLSDYVFIGHGRSADYSGEGTPIAYRRDRFRLHAFFEEWMTSSPHTPGTKLACAVQGCPRVICTAELILRENGRRFAFCNVHTDNKSEETRTIECVMLMHRLSSVDCPLVITGDFNAHPDTPPIRAVLTSGRKRPLRDLTANIPWSFHGFCETPKGGKIDYIFTDLPEGEQPSYAVADPITDGRFYSDHLSLCAYVALGEEKEENT